MNLRRFTMNINEILYGPRNILLCKRVGPIQTTRVQNASPLEFILLCVLMSGRYTLMSAGKEKQQDLRRSIFYVHICAHFNPFICYLFRFSKSARSVYVWYSRGAAFANCTALQQSIVACSAFEDSVLCMYVR